MAEVRIVKPTPKQIRWAAGREFVHLPPVDPAFAAGNMGWLRRMVLRHLALPGNYRRIVGLLLEVDDLPAGYLFASPRQYALRIDTLAVEPGYRRQGYASQLLARAGQIATERELTCLSATLTSQNQAARAFFDKHGFLPYRAQRWSLQDVAQLSDAGEAATLRELGPAELIDVYKRWSAYELEQGDAWALEVVQAEYPNLALKARARHWACLLDGEQVGYLRIAGLRSEFDVYLATERELWEQPLQLEWLVLALMSYPSLPAEIHLALASSAHHQAVGPILQARGFQEVDVARFLLFKPLA